MIEVGTDAHLLKTQSLCPTCMKRIDAYYIGENDNVYMVKTCPEHTTTKTLVWKGIEHWRKWFRPMANNEMDHCGTTVDKGCPFDCGLCPEHKQHTCCVLLELTQACNLMCPICFASANEAEASKSNPSLETIGAWYDMLMAKGGPFNIQLSGGEPTIRDDLPDIIRLGKSKGFTFFQLNTNGIRIAQDKAYLKELIEAGLSTVFLQFDGFKDSTYEKLRGEKLLDIKMKAIDNCRAFNQGVVLVPTIKKGVNDDEIGAIIDFALEHMPIVRSVHFQPISFFGRYNERENGRVTIPCLLNAIEKQTGGRILAESFSPGNAEHSHCSFHCDILKEDSGALLPMKKTGGCCSSKQAMDVVSKKWQTGKAVVTKENEGGLDTRSLDDFLLKKKNQTVSISGMAFQDIWNVDMNRLKRCYIHEVSEEGTLIPFCAYNLTSEEGKSLYRNRIDN